MSILLEALKKSEQQRRLGETPSIHSPSAESEAGGVFGQSWIPALMVALSALAMAWFGWQQYRAPDTVDALIEVAELPAPAAGPAESAAATKETGGEPVTNGARPDAPADSAQVVKPGLVARQRSPQRTPVESFRAEGKPSQASAESSAGPAATAAEEPSARPRNSRANEASQQYAPEPGSAPDPGQAVASSTSPAREAFPASGAAETIGMEPHQPEPITFWELPQSVRDSMPEMHLTVLVFAEQPEDRFVLIGGQRLREGDEYESGVRLEEIRRGGAVFLYRNYRFLVKG